MGCFAFIVALAALIAAWPVMMAWNAIAPDMWGVMHITFWHAWGGLTLMGIAATFLRYIFAPRHS